MNNEYKWDKHGNLLRADQSPVNLEVGDRFFDCALGRWGLLIEILPQEVSLGAPLRALYDGCDKFNSFISRAMMHDIGEVVKCK